MRPRSDVFQNDAFKIPAGNALIVVENVVPMQGRAADSAGAAARRESGTPFLPGGSAATQPQPLARYFFEPFADFGEPVSRAARAAQKFD